MNLTIARNLLLTGLVMGAAPALAETTAVVVAPAVVAAIAPPMTNVGIVGVALWSTTAIGPAWVDFKGMSLYNYDLDSGGKSLCNADCAATWVPLAAAADATGVDEWTVTTRDDGAKQWAFRSHPLYTFVKDTLPGEVNGDGVAGFHLAD